MRASAIAGVLIASTAIAASLLAGPALDARLLDAGFAFNRAWFSAPIEHDVVVVGIDDAFVDGIGEPLALSHRYLANFVQRASQAGARVVALDLLLPEKRYDQLSEAGEPGADFHRSLLAGLIGARQHSVIVAAKVWDHERRRFQAPHLDFSAVLGDDALASALVCWDADGRVRAYPGAGCQPPGAGATLSSAAAAAMGAQGKWSGLIDYQRGPAFDYVPLQQVLAMDDAALRRLVGGRAVLLGSVQADVDLIGVPVPLARWLPREHRVPGVLVHAQALRSMLNDGLIQPVGKPLIMAGMLLACAFWLRPSVRAKLLLLALATGLLLAAAAVLLRDQVWIAPGALLIAAWASALGRGAWQGWQYYRDRQRLGRTFGGYVSPEVLRQILAGAIDAREAGRTLQVCVMFTDIRGFTTLSERLPAQQVVELLNRYFARMTAAVHRHGGTVDKFIGDGMMAFFGAPNLLPDPARHAFDAARAMLAELAALNAELANEGRQALVIGIGIHIGPAVIGHIGSPERHEYTAIGDTVNIAARLESLCGKLRYPIICSGDAAALLVHAAPLEPLGTHELKGHTPLAVFGCRE